MSPFTGSALQSPGSGTGTVPPLVKAASDRFRGSSGDPGLWFQDALAGLRRSSQGLYDHPMRNLSGTRVELTAEEGVGYCEVTRVGDEFLTVAPNLSFKEPRIAAVRGDGLVRFIFHLSGDRTLGVSRGAQWRAHRPSLMVYQQPAGVQFHEETAASSRLCGVAVTLRAQYLTEQFLTSGAHTSPQLSLLARSGQIQCLQLPLSAQMFELAGSLVHNPYSETALRLLHTEAVTLQLLCAAVQRLSNITGAPSERFTDRELRCLHQARRFLMKQLSPVPTIRQVARAAGINETSLKQGFKAVFGDTLYNFSVRCRMERAFRLLQEECMSISKIANTVGYMHQTSFATAFRRQFGVSPRDVRQPRSR